MGSFLSGHSGRSTQSNNPAWELRFSTSLYGLPVAIGYGQQRLSGNVIWYGFFEYHWQSGSSGGGKGGGGKSGGNGTYNYSVSVEWAFCEGPITDYELFYYNSGSGYLSFPTTRLNGTYPQSTWGYLDANDPGQSLHYNGVAIIAAANLWLGTSTSLPNFGAEIRFAIWNGGVAGQPDANAADVINDFLTNPHYGVPGFPAAVLAGLTPYRTYTRAMGMAVSIALTSQRPAQQFLTDLTKVTNSEFVWSSGLLRIIPYADKTVTGNGVTYTVSLTPVYDLTGDDFLAPVKIKRKPRSQMINAMRGSYLERGQNYNPLPVEVRDEGSIAQYGILRPSDQQQMDMFCFQSAAMASLQAQLHRAQIAATYEFPLGAWAILLDPMDIVTLTEPQYGLYRQAVRITEITENDDGSLTFTADEVLGSIGAPLYGAQAALAPATDINAAPGNINPPVIFEPPYQWANALELGIAVSGVNPAIWGGCEVWASSDDLSYAFVGLINGPSRMGVTTADLPPVAAAATGQTIDGTHTLAVDLTESVGTLVSVSPTALAAADTACWVGGEIVAFQTATLTAASKYNLTTLLRGAYGSTIADHPAGSPIVRLDQAVVSQPYSVSQIGQTVYFKFLSFNLWGGGKQSLADVGAYNYTITGSALAGPTQTPTNLRANVYVDGFMQLWWDEVSDFRSGLRYRVLKGTSLVAAQQVGDQAHPPFLISGDGTYWVQAYVQPTQGAYVTGGANSLTIAGTMLSENVLITSDQQALNWPGTLTNLVSNGASGSEFLSLVSQSAPGIYEIPSANWINIGYAGVAAISVNWLGVGDYINANILATTDFLGNPDFLGAAATQYTQSWIEIAIAPAGATPVWGAWQKFVPGNYTGQWFKLRGVVLSTTPTVRADLLKFSIKASVPARIDHYQNQSIPAGGLTITFQPDGATGPAPFNGGPNGNPVPYWNVTAGSLSAGDVLDIVSLSLSSMTIKILNGGVGAARSGVNIDVEGY